MSLELLRSVRHQRRVLYYAPARNGSAPLLIISFHFTRTKKDPSECLRIAFWDKFSARRAAPAFYGLWTKMNSALTGVLCKMKQHFCGLTCQNAYLRLMKATGYHESL